MKDLNTIGEELFDKIRSRFPSVTIGGENGKTTNEPTEARFFDFEYQESGRSLGNISLSISEDDGLTVIYSKDIVANEDSATKNTWFEFLKDLRQFSKKRLMDFDVRDITKSNLTKRDYKFLSNRRFGDSNMNESKLYGTARTSYQKVGEARIMIKHTENINLEASNPRTKKIGTIYIESASGERFKYPFKHLSGARAMARHVAEGGNLYDDFGSHIIGLSEEMSKLRKFKSYMGRSAVMAESLSEYMDIVKDRINTVRKTITSLQKPKFYAEAFAAYEAPILEDVPADVRENWIDELTIKQFNEELADVFPYIYKLVSEATKAKLLGPDDLIDESGLQYYTGKKKYGKEGMAALAKAGREGASEEELGAIKDKYKKTKEELELEAAFEATLGQFSDTVCEECGKQKLTAKEIDELANLEEGERHGNSKIYDKCWSGCRKVAGKKRGEPGSCKCDEDDTDEGKQHDKDGDGDEDGDDYKISKDIAIKKAIARAAEKEPKKESKTPLGEFILSYFDKESGEFPKGETAVLTMVEKDYGEQFIEPAKAFIEQVSAKFEEWQMRNQPQQLETEGEIGERSQFEIYRNSIVLYDPTTMEVKRTYPMNHRKKASADADKLDLIATDGAEYMELVRDKKRMAAQDTEKQAELPLRKEPKKPGALDRIKSLAGLS